MYCPERPGPPSQRGGGPTPSGTKRNASQTVQPGGHSAPRVQGASSARPHPQRWGHGGRARGLASLRQSPRCPPGATGGAAGAINRSLMRAILSRPIPAGSRPTALPPNQRHWPRLTEQATIPRHRRQATARNVTRSPGFAGPPTPENETPAPSMRAVQRCRHGREAISPHSPSRSKRETARRQRAAGLGGTPEARIAAPRSSKIGTPRSTRSNPGCQAAHRRAIAPRAETPRFPLGTLTPKVQTQTSGG